MTHRTLIPASDWRRLGNHIIVTCPGCRESGALEHDVNEAGEVNPSLDCPNDLCNFHAMVTLDEWDGDEIQQHQHRGG